MKIWWTLNASLRNINSDPPQWTIRWKTLMKTSCKTFLPRDSWLKYCCGWEKMMSGWILFWQLKEVNKLKYHKYWWATWSSSSRATTMRSSMSRMPSCSFRAESLNLNASNNSSYSSGSNSSIRMQKWVNTICARPVLLLFSHTQSKTISFW